MKLRQRPKAEKDWITENAQGMAETIQKPHGTAGELIPSPGR